MGAYEQYLQQNRTDEATNVEDSFTKQQQSAIYERNIKENLPVLEPIAPPEKARGITRRKENDVLNEVANKRQK